MRKLASFLKYYICHESSQNQVLKLMNILKQYLVLSELKASPVSGITMPSLTTGRSLSFISSSPLSTTVATRVISLDPVPSELPLTALPFSLLLRRKVEFMAVEAVLLARELSCSERVSCLGVHNLHQEVWVGGGRRCGGRGRGILSLASCHHVSNKVCVS